MIASNACEKCQEKEWSVETVTTDNKLLYVCSSC